MFKWLYFRHLNIKGKCIYYANKIHFWRKVLPVQLEAITLNNNIEISRATQDRLLITYYLRAEA